MKRYLSLIFYLLLSTAVFSNDASIVLGSSVEIIDNGATNIIMLEEEIVITLSISHYEVSVSFDFYNDGPEETVLLGFPVLVSIFDKPEEREWAKISDFNSYINGELVTEYITKTEESERKYGYITETTWFIRKVTFPEKAHTYSKVTYKAPYNMLGYKRGAGYIFGTGRTWKNSIGKMSIIINHEDDTLIGDVHFWEKRSYDELICDASGRYRYILNNIEPDTGESLTIYVRRLSTFEEYKGQFGESWDGGWIWNEMLIEEYSETNLYTRNQLKLFKNFFYAMHGYDFDNPLLKDYFQNLPPSWHTEYIKYKVDPKFSERKFNKFERKNLDYLTSLEKMIPGEENPSEFDNFMEKILASVKEERAANLPDKTDYDKQRKEYLENKNPPLKAYIKAYTKKYVIKYVKKYAPFVVLLVIVGYIFLLIPSHILVLLLSFIYFLRLLIK